MASRTTSRRSFVSAAAGVLAAPFIGRANGSSPPTTGKPNREPLALPLVNPSIIVTKSKRILRLYSKGKLVREYRAGLGSSPVEDKIKAGDRRTPEGEFYICLKNAQSKFYLSLELSYPNRRHADRGLRDGLITRSQYNQIVAALERKGVPLQNTHLGGELFIHGNGARSDWTWGCVALEDKDIRELFDSVPLGTPVTIEH
jgi:murein L,D-transpeptidase YafK